MLRNGQIWMGNTDRGEEISILLSKANRHGLVAGATLTVEYEMESAGYEITLTGSASGWSISGNGIYQKSGGTWSAASSVTLDESIGRK